MRKISILLAILVSVLASAQTLGKFTLFAPNASGDIVITKVYPTSKSQADVEKYFIRALNEDDGNLEEVSAGVYKGSIQTQAYYNPFAGSTKRGLKMTVKIAVAQGEATVTISKLYVTELYAGYGMHDNSWELEDKMEQYKDALAAAKPTKDQKECIKDSEKLYLPSEEELQKRLDIAATKIK